MREPLLSDLPYPIELHPALPAARSALVAAMNDLLAVPDDALEHGWDWQGHPADVRYGFYRTYETLEAATGAVRRVLDETGARPAPGARAATGATEARWDLHGRILAIAATALDVPPGGEEWTVRRTLGHIVSGQRSYALYSAWWLLQRGAATLPERAPEDLGFPVPDEADEAMGTGADIRERLDGRLDAAMAAFGGLDDAALAVPARWSGIPVELRFRLGRWASHIREHTVQVDKTLAVIGWTPREVDRLVGLVASAWGRLEGQVFGLPVAALEQGGSGGSAAAIVTAAARQVAEDAASVRAAGAS